MKAKHPVQDQRCQSGPSARNSVIPSEGDFSKNCWADQRLQISDLHLVKFPNPATFACWNIRFKTEVCISSQFPTEAMPWIKEVEMVDSVDFLKYSCSVKRNSHTRCEDCFSTEHGGTKKPKKKIVSSEEDRSLT